MSKKSTLLIVDDEVANIEIMNAVLEAQYEICFATSGEEALELARDVLPDLILLDVLMPGMDGYQVCDVLKRDPLLADVPVIFITGLDDQDAEQRGLALGAMDYVTKPIRPVSLRAKVANHIEMKRMRDTLAELAVTDALTGLNNRRKMDDVLRHQVSQLARTRDWLSVVMIDIDFFKLFNDTYGHPEGDRCITMVASALNRAVHRAADVKVRYGGEEFACILPQTDPQGAIQVAHDIKRQVEMLHIPHEKSTVSPYVTVSVGVASALCRPSIRHDEWVRHADRQLYISKQNGRDRISAVSFEPETA